VHTWSEGESEAENAMKGRDEKDKDGKRIGKREIECF